MAHVLIIDDEPQMCELLVRLVEKKGHNAEFVQSLAAGLRRVEEGGVDLVYLDVYMPDGNGQEALSAILAGPSQPEVIIMTGMSDPDGAELAIRSGAWDYVEKGSPLTAFALPLIRGLEYRAQKQAQQRGAPLKHTGLLGSGPKMRACFDLLYQATNGEANVLLCSETGTGKELLAQAIHENSRRCDQPFVVVDCTALPEQLVESVLFGHCQGAFTGATKSQTGLIKQADGGTLFLDEIGELPLMVQKSFLRALQERRFRPLGGDREASSDFRLVAATNRDLDEMTARGDFREDLLYRLRGLTITLPPLRERREDIEEIARFHIERICNLYETGCKDASPEFLEALQRYDWPGNVRELVNTVEHAVTAANGSSLLHPHHMPREIRARLVRGTLKRSDGSGSSRRHASARGLATDAPLRTLSLHRESAVQTSECAYLQRLMLQHGDSVKEACRVSGLSRSRLYALLQKHSLSRPA